MSILHVAFLGCSVGLSAGLIMVLLARGEAVRNFVLALAMAGLMACATGCGGAPTATASQSVTATDGGAADGGRACALLCWARVGTTSIGYGCEPSGSAVTMVPFDAGCRVSATECTAVVEARCDGNGPYICCRNDLTIP